MSVSVLMRSMWWGNQVRLTWFRSSRKISVKSHTHTFDLVFFKHWRSSHSIYIKMTLSVVGHEGLSMNHKHAVYYFTNTNHISFSRSVLFVVSRSSRSHFPPVANLSISRSRELLIVWNQHTSRRVTYGERSIIITSVRPLIWFWQDSKFKVFHEKECWWFYEFSYLFTYKQTCFLPLYKTVLNELYS